jgi:hypothetical protein
MGFWRSWVETTVSCAALAGCGGHSLDVGSNDAGSTEAKDSEPMLLPLGPGPDASGATSQVWIGHLVNHQFANGSDALTMRLDFAPGGQVTGTLLLGDGALLQPPSDPNVGYPQGNQGVISLVEGFPYTILDGTLSGTHLSVQISEYEVWTQWCALQTPYLVQLGNDAGPGGVYVGPDIYACVPEGPVGGTFGFGPMGCELASNDGAISPLDCGKLRLCGGAGPMACQCSATGCQVYSPPTPGTSLDLVLAPSTADGALTGEFGDDPVQFTRSQ